MPLSPAHIYYYYSSGSQAAPDVTADGKQAFLIIGDSIAAGTGEELGPETAANTLYSWNGTDIDEITTTDISTNPGGTDGTMWKQFAIDHKANTGYASVIYNAGVSSSEFFTDGTSGNWSVDGALYAPMKTSADNLLEYLDVERFGGIHIILGINDVRGGAALADIYTAMDSLISRLTTDFPDTPILICQIGQTESSQYNARLYGVRNKIVNLATDNDNVHLCGNLQAIIPTAGFHDSLHPSQANNNLFGSIFARWYKNSSYSKWGRSVLSSMFDEPGSARKTLIDNCVAGHVTDGNWFGLEYLFVFKTGTEQNRYVDWSFMTNYLNGGSPVFNANDNLETTGGNDYLDIAWRNDISIGDRATSTDFIVGGKIKVNNVAQGTNGNLCGVAAASGNSSVIAIGQTTTPSVIFRGGDATATTTGETKLADNSMYAVARNGTDKHHVKNGVVSTATSQASLGVTNRRIYFAAFNNGTTITFLNGQFHYAFMSKFSSFDAQKFHDRMETLLSNW